MRRLTISLVGLVFVLFTLAANASETSKSVEFVTDPEKEGGFLIEVTKAAFRKMGYTVTSKPCADHYCPSPCKGVRG